MPTIRNRSDIAAIRQTIAEYMRYRTEPNKLTLQAFVGMIETGEATLEDFRDVGGRDLASAVKTAIECGI